MSAFSTPGFFPIDSVFGAPQLTKAVKARVSGVPKRLPAGFYESKPAFQVARNTGLFKRRYGTQQNAPIIGYGQAMKEGAAVAEENVPFIVISQGEILPIKMADFVGLIKESSEGSNLLIDEGGIEYIGTQVSEFQQRFIDTRLAVTHLALAQDAVYVGTAGQILPSSTGAAYTIQSGVQATHQGQLNGILTAGWENPSTDIPTQILGLLRQAAADFAGDGPTLEYAFFGKNIPKYLFTNTALIQYLRLNEAQNVGYIANAKMPEQGSLLNLKWVDCSALFYRQAPASTAFNANALVSGTNPSGITAPGDGTVTPIWGDDTIVFTPDPAKVDFWRTYEGHFRAPKDSQLAYSDPGRAITNFQDIRGMGAYAGVRINPPGVDIYMFDNFLPCIPAPNSIYQAVVNF
jgi:hypothetical protein